MSKQKIPGTRAIQTLKQQKATFTPHLYRYTDHGGTRVCALELGVDEHLVIKTLIMETEQGTSFIILMHGDCEVSQKDLARQLQTKHVTPCTKEKAERMTGYQTGGISPFGTRNQLPVYMEATIATLDTVYINGGRHGLLVSISPQEICRILSPTEVTVAIA